MDQSSDPPGFAGAIALPWIERQLGPLQRPVEVVQLTGGRSNLTYRVTGAEGTTCVLRRPPMGTVLPTAHDMQREHRILAALGGTGFPVPRVHGYRPPSDETAEFYVMDYVGGHILEHVDDAAALTVAARRTAGESLVDALIDLHRIEPETVGLGDLGRRTGYVERQLRRWSRQWELTKTEEVPEMAAVHGWLAEHVPPEGEGAIVHGDVRFGNAVFSDDGQLSALLDWELCTLGDPLADVGYLLLTWDEPGDDVAVRPDGPTRLPGFPGRREALERYASRSGRDVSRIDYYITLQAWRLACINQGVYSRYLSGDSGMASTDIEAIKRSVDRLVDVAVRGLSPSD